MRDERRAIIHPGPTMMFEDPSYPLPIPWVWTRKDWKNGLFYARDSRWDPTVPDVCDTSPAAVARYARECNANI